MGNKTNGAFALGSFYYVKPRGPSNWIRLVAIVGFIARFPQIPFK